MNALAQPATSVASAAAIPLLRTLVLCDLVDSTALTERLGDQRAADLFRKHDRLTRALLPVHAGREIDKTDGFLLMFDRPLQAVAFALDYSRALRELNVAEGSSLAARIGIHVGDLVAWDNSPDDIARGAKPIEIEGLVKPITARLMQLALPNQILLSGVAHALAHRAQGELGARLETVRWRTHGRYRFKGIPDPIPVFEVGDEGFAPLKPPPWSGKAHREVPFWRRPATLGIELFAAALMLVVPAWYLFKPAPAIAFAQRDWVVVGDLKNLTGDSRFDESVETAFRIGLEQSRYINVLPDLKTRETVALMQRDPEHTPIDRAIGSEIALRDGARALILPTIAEIGGRVRVTAEVVDPDTQTTVYSESADGRGVQSVLPLLDTVNQKLRLRLGEALATVSNDSHPLEKVATRDLDALRAYTKALQSYRTGTKKDALTFLQRALDLENTPAEQEIDRAMALHDRLAPREALYVEAWKAQFGAPRPALEKWRTLASLYPDFFTATGTYGYFAWQSANDFAAAQKAYGDAPSDKNPDQRSREYLTGVLALGQDDYSAAARHFTRAQELGSSQWSFLAAMYAAQRNFVKFESVLARHAVETNEEQGLDGWNLPLGVAADRGRWSDVEQVLKQARARLGPDRPRDQRQLRLLDASLARWRVPPGKRADGFATLVHEEAAASAKESSADRAETAFRILLAGYLAAAGGDPKTAELAATQAGALARSGDYPNLSRMLAITQAEIARIAGKPRDAIRVLLAAPLDGTELCLTHVALLDAYDDAGDRKSALEHARWLAQHRGRAYAEYNANWIARPFNVAQSDMALLRMAELSHALGDQAAVRTALDQFRLAWPDAARDPFIEPRLGKLQPAP